MNEERVTYFAETDARNKRVRFGIKAKDRTRHVYVIGKTGMGKSTLLENMAVQDIQNGEGMAFIDPHGKTADLLLEYIPQHRIKDVVYFAPFDLDYPISFNVLENVDPDKRHLVVSGLMSTFKKIWEDAWSARMEYILTNTLLALLEYPEATLLGVNRMLSDKDFRKKVVACITDPSVRSFWVDEFANYTERMAAEAVPAIQNKVGQFTANPLIRNMIGQPRSSFDIRKMMDERKIMIVNLSKGRVGEANANLLGGMMITKIYLAAMSRADTPDRILKTLPNFYLFVDEFQNFANESFADILSEARKYKLNLTVAHQYIEQMEEEVRAAVFGNVGTMISFRVGAYDAEVLEKEFAPQFTAEDIVNLGQFQLYLKLMIDGVSSQPFSARTLGPIPQAPETYVPRVLAASREQFALKREDVEKAIVEWMAPVISKPVARAKDAGKEGGREMPSVSRDVPKTPAPMPTPAAAPTTSTAPAVAPIAKAAPTAPAVTPAAATPRPAVPRPPAPRAPVPPPLARTSTPASPSSPVTPTPPVAKPVSLSSLAKKPVKNDAKAQTPKNVLDLKSALAAVMKDSKNAQTAPVAPTSVATPSPALAVPHVTSAPATITTPVATHTTTQTSTSVPTPASSEQKEIPKDVLEGMFKTE